MSEAQAPHPGAGPLSGSRTFCPRQRRRFVLIVAILASAMAFIDGSVISIAVPAIRADLSASLADMQWVSNAYLLFLSALMLVGGAAGDRFGLRTVFIFGIALFVAASAGCAVAADTPWLIASRIVQGIGAAFMVPSSLAIIAKAYPREERGRAIGIWAAASALTTTAGPILGGFALTALGEWSWRLVFAINLPIGVVALGLLIFMVPPDDAADRRRIDVIGGLLATAALALIALALTNESEVPNLTRAAGLGAAGLAVLAGFLFWEARAKHPMVPLGLFTVKAFSGANFLTFCVYFALGAVMFFLPMTAVSAWGANEAMVAFALLPLGIAITTLSSVGGWLADRFGAGPPITAGSCLVATAFAGIALVSPLEMLFETITPLIALMGIGMALLVSPLSAAVMGAVGDEDTGIASGINNAVSRVASLVAVAAMGGLAAFTFALTVGPAVPQGLSFGSIPEIDLSAGQSAQFSAASNAALSAVAWVSAGLAALSALVSHLTLDRHLPVKPVSQPTQ
ncbi:MFS transporter [Cucumibacter marinus]|uniref:MFS transporter n=1 Tax=Cucumibacter marinus TaxID=1121252 RepID=UPI0003F6B31F|nr:MFS transporter [Cucumibacter marinus]